jgi:hypothetical protein
MTPPSSPRAGEPKTDLRASLTDALDYWWNFDEESGQRRTSHATLESIIPSMVAEVLARRMESQGWRAGEAEGGVRLGGEWPRFKPGEECPECGATMHGYPCVHHIDGCSILEAALASPEPDEEHAPGCDGNCATRPGSEQCFA